MCTCLNLLGFLILDLNIIWRIFFLEELLIFFFAVISSLTIYLSCTKSLKAV